MQSLSVRRAPAAVAVESRFDGSSFQPFADPGAELPSATAASPRHAEGSHKAGRCHDSARARGFSLIEVLVAVLVMGIGVLGVTALQMVSLQNNRMALERGEAVQLAYDIMDRIRANPQGVPPGAAYGGIGIGDPPPAAPDCMANICTAAQMIDFDRASWKCQLGDFNDNAVCQDMRTNGLLPVVGDQPGLPNGDGAIAVDGAGVITVTVQWSGVDNAVQQVVIDSQG